MSLQDKFGRIMGKTFHRLHVHLVWATKSRAPILSDEVQGWLLPALAEKARALGSGYVVVGGVADHVHVLAQFDAAYSIASVVAISKVRAVGSRICAAWRSFPGKKGTARSPSAGKISNESRIAFAASVNTTRERRLCQILKNFHSLSRRDI